jgi:hypothetical protein
LKVGDKLIGFDEDNLGYGRKYRTSVVESMNFKMVDDMFDVVLSTGEIITATGDHRWLICNSGKGGGGWFRWKTTRQLLPSNKNPNYCNKLIRLIPIVNPSLDYDSGYLAGIIDGEGWINERGMMAFAQRPGDILDKSLLALKRKGRSHSLSPVIKQVTKGLGKGDCMRVDINGDLAHRLSFLQEVRPQKLMNINPDCFGRLERRPHTELVTVEEVRPAATKEIVQIGTSTKTLIVEGFPMHNCEKDVEVLEDVWKTLIGFKAESNRSV